MYRILAILFLRTLNRTSVELKLGAVIAAIVVALTLNRTSVELKLMPFRKN